MQEKEQFLLEREIIRLLNDFNRCSDPVYKELIKEDVLLLSTVIAHIEKVL